MSKKILLMFLGGETVAPNLIKHLKNMNTTFVNKDNFYVVIHPMKLENYKCNNDFRCIFKNENIYIVPEDHHIMTGWATHSLTEATLLMMQYATIKNNNDYFDKYILLSSLCMPLYTFDEIYNELIIDNKSWINGSLTSTSNGYTNINIWMCSQWFIFDKQHAKLFFHNENDKFVITYEKNNEILNCPKNNIQSINIINEIFNKIYKFDNNNYANYFYSYKNNILINKPSLKHCDPSDEKYKIYYQRYINKKINKYT